MLPGECRSPGHRIHPLAAEGGCKALRLLLSPSSELQCTLALSCFWRSLVVFVVILGQLLLFKMFPLLQRCCFSARASAFVIRCSPCESACLQAQSELLAIHVFCCLLCSWVSSCLSSCQFPLLLRRCFCARAVVMISVLSWRRCRFHNFASPNFASPCTVSCCCFSKLKLKLVCSIFC